MQQFDILGNVKVTAEVKTKIDDSPLVQKAPENMGLLNTNGNKQQNIQDYTSEYLKNNNAILQEFGTVVSDAVRNLQLFNDKIRENINIPKISTGLDPNNGKTVFAPVNKFDNDDESNIINIIESPKNDNVIPNIVETPKENIADNKVIEKTIIQPENKAAEANVFNPVEPKEEKIISIVEPSKNEIDSTPNIFELPRSEYSVKDIEPDNTIKGKTFIQSGENISAQNENINTQEKLQAWSEDLNTSSDSLKDNVEYMKQFGVLMPDIIKNFQAMNDIVNRTNQNLPAVGRIKTRDDVKKQQLGTYTQQNILGMLNTGGNMIQSAAGGNIGGSVIQGVSGVASTANNLSRMANIEDMTGLAKGLMVGGGVLMAGAAVLKGGKALADAYKDAMPTIFSTGKAFGTTDDTKSMALYNTVNKSNEGTGLDLREFNSLIVDLRKQGVGNNLKSDQAQATYTSSIAETTAKWAYATGGDVTQYTNLAGLMSRYGKSKDVSNDFNYLVTAGKASGLNDSQIPEFLSNIQKVMEDGIANGFSRSATEVADTLLMFSKMSGNNAFWQSEKGAKMLSQANSGLANATGLNKTSDIIAYSAISKAYSGTVTDEKTGKTISKEQAALGNDLYQDKGDYVNKMMLLEQGLNPQNFGSIMSSLIDVEGKENVTGQIERLREMFGLNYTGASRLLKLYQDNGGNVDNEKLKQVMSAPENQNAETKWQKSVNQIAESIQKMGQPVFKVELGAMSGIASDVSKIANFLIKPEDNGSGFSEDNPIEEDKKKRGAITTDYEINKAEAEKRTENLPEWKQKLIRAQSSVIDPRSDGSGYTALVDHYEKFDLTKEKYDSPMVEKVSPEDAPGIIKNNIFLTPKIKDQAQREWAQKKGFKITQPYSDDATISDFLLEPMQNVISNLALSNGGKVSQNALMDAIEKSPEIKNELKKDVKNGYLEDNEIKNLTNIMNKIYAELLAGINVNQTY